MPAQRAQEAPRRTKLQAQASSSWTSYRSARRAVRAGVPLEAFLQHRLAYHLGCLPVAPERLPDVVIAYEPIWAIGTGRVATPDQAQEAIAFVRALVGDRSKEAAERVRVLYGGSVKPGNAAALFAMPDIDGGLIGGAALVAEDFLAIGTAAARQG